MFEKRSENNRARNCTRRYALRMSQHPPRISLPSHNKPSQRNCSLWARSQHTASSMYRVLPPSLGQHRVRGFRKKMKNNSFPILKSHILRLSSCQVTSHYHKTKFKWNKENQRDILMLMKKLVGTQAQRGPRDTVSISLLWKTVLAVRTPEKRLSVAKKKKSPE